MKGCGAMIIWWTILVILLVIIVAAVSHHLWLIRRQRQEQQLLDRQMNLAVTNWARQNDHLAPQSLRSEIPVSIWHRDVLVFEYQVTLTSTAQLPLTVGGLEQILRREVKLPADLVVTECWQLQDKLHFDVAYLANHATKNYVHDMARVLHSDAIKQKKTPVVPPKR